jgi:glyceraldehyde 3-phosphate dehydrogenase
MPYLYDKDRFMSEIRPRIAINGLGRIGKLVFRLLWDKGEVDIVAVNDLAPNATLAHLLKYDSSQGMWPRATAGDDLYLYVDGKKIIATAHKDALECPWKELDVDVVVECSGHFRTREKAGLHLQAGAKKIAISAPGDKTIKTIVLGINDDQMSVADTIISNASCTTNCLAPLVKVLDAACGIQQAFISTIHAYTADQNLQDGIHSSDMRRARAAAQNIVPTSTNATNALTWVMPHMEGKIAGSATRVPVVAGSLTELYAIVDKPIDADALNQYFRTNTEGALKGILGYTEDPVVSSDIIGSPYSCLFDAQLTAVQGNFIKVTGWYDNEFGYASRLSELVVRWAGLK